MHVTIFGDTYSPVGVVGELTEQYGDFDWDDFCQLVTRPVDGVTQKTDLPAFNLTEYKTKDHPGVILRDDQQVSRCKQNCLYVDGVILDIDNNRPPDDFDKTLQYDRSTQVVTIESVKQTLKQYRFVLYPSYSHREKVYRWDGKEWVESKSPGNGVDKFRVIIPFDQRITADEYQKLDLSSMFPFAADESFRLNQLFYLFINRDFWDEIPTYINDGVCLDVSTIAKKREQKRQTRQKTSFEPPNFTKNVGNINTFDIVRWFQDNGLIIDTGETGRWHKCQCPLHDHHSSDPWAAYTITNGTWGFKCHHTSHGEFNRKQLIEYIGEDINSYLEQPVDHSNYLVSQLQNISYQNNTVHSSIEMPRIPALITYKERYLQPLELVNGSLFVKSPTGSGKTKQLEDLLARHRDKSVLVIGHRVSLIKSMTDRLNIQNYQEIETFSNAKRLGICINSIVKVKDNKYQVVIIDESEQVLRHLLSDSTTIKPQDRKRVAEIFYYMLRNAETVITLDADLGQLTYEAVKYIRPHVKNYAVVNTYKEQKTIQIYENIDDLKYDAYKLMANGEDVYVAMNSKKQVDSFYDVLTDSLDDANIVRFTSSQRDEHQLELIQQTSDDNQLIILASPSIGTGIDIKRPMHVFYCAVMSQAPGGEDGGHTNQWDVNQAINRVRHPLSTNVWIYYRTFNNPTDVELFKASIFEHYLYNANNDDFKLHWYKWIIEFYSVAKSNHVRSTNNLLFNYWKMKADSGCLFEHVRDRQNEQKSVRKSTPINELYDHIDSITPDDISRVFMSFQDRDQPVELLKFDRHQYVAIYWNVLCLFGEVNRYNIDAYWNNDIRGRAFLYNIMIKHGGAHKIDKLNSETRHIIDWTRYGKQRPLLIDFMKNIGWLKHNKVTDRGIVLHTTKQLKDILKVRSIVQVRQWLKDNDLVSIDQFVKWLDANKKSLISNRLITKKMFDQKPLTIINHLLKQVGLKISRRTIQGVRTASRNPLKGYYIDEQWLKSIELVSSRHTFDYEKTLNKVVQSNKRHHRLLPPNPIKKAS